MSQYHNLPCEIRYEQLILQKLLNQANCKELQTDADFEIFTERIKQRNINTWKRVFGHLPHPGKFNQNTLNIIANFLGYSQWEDLLQEIQNQTPNFATQQTDQEYSVIVEQGTAVNLRYGQRIEIRYRNNKNTILEGLGNDNYKVISSTSNQLQFNDILIIKQLSGGVHLTGSIIRNQRNIGQYYSSAIIEKITHISANPNYE